MAEMAAELREQVTELLGEPNEAIVDALLVYATNKVAHVAGAALTARWRAEDELTEARGAIERVKAQHRQDDPEDPMCRHCRMTWPCPTIRTLADAHSPADARTPVTAGTEAHGEAGETQRGPDDD